MDLLHSKPIFPHGEASSRGVPVRVEHAAVLSVDVDAWTVHAQPIGEDRIITDVPLLTPYEHPVDGSGIYFLPRRGALGTIIYYDRGNPRFMLYRSERSPRAAAEGQPPRPSYKGAKHDLAEGDMIMKTAFGSYLLLRDTGVIDMVSSPALRSSLLPVTNTWLHRSENIDVSTVGGRWWWRHNRRATRTNLIETYRERAIDEPVLTTIKGFHENRAVLTHRYEDGSRRVLWSIGSIIPGEESTDSPVGVDQTILDSLPTGVKVPPMEAPGDDRLVLDIDDGSYRQTIGQRDDGTVLRTKVAPRGEDPSWTVRNRVGRQEDGVITENIVASKSGETEYRVVLTVKEDGQIDLALEDLNESKLTLTIDKDGNITLTTGGVVTIDSDDVRLGSTNPQEQAILGNMFQKYLEGAIDHLEGWLKGHTHIGNMGSPTAPPIQAEALKTPKMPDSNLSQEVRLEP